MFLSQTEQLHLFSAFLMPLPCEVKLKQWIDYMRPLWTWGWQTLLSFIPLWLQFTLKSKLCLDFRWKKLLLFICLNMTCVYHTQLLVLQSAPAHKCAHVHVLLKWSRDGNQWICFHQLCVTLWSLETAAMFYGHIRDQVGICWNMLIN